MFALRFLKIFTVPLASILVVQSLSWHNAAPGAAGQPFSVGLQLGTPALAGYTPPKRRGPRRTAGAGARGCQGPIEVAMMPLVPDGYAGLTLSGHPTLFWYMPIASEVELVLTEIHAPAPLLDTRLTVQAGITQFTLPKDAPELLVGRNYRWSISMVCPGFNRESARPFAQGYIERIAPPPEVTQQLAAVSKTGSPIENLLQKAEIYGAAGIWYDTLAAVSSAYFVNPQDSSLLDARLSLLEQVGLTKVIEQEKHRLAHP
ncbi:MAG: DUF928 domain-containing protein [Scytolyngbya sp. HA4215-MV1]|nr:DUF928 domain-containing protein [Scytolyngbya sp. HA4215-MV1]